MRQYYHEQERATISYFQIVEQLQSLAGLEVTKAIYPVDSVLYLEIGHVRTEIIKLTKKTIKRRTSEFVAVIWGKWVYRDRTINTVYSSELIAVNPDIGEEIISSFAGQIIDSIHFSLQFDLLVIWFTNGSLEIAPRIGGFFNLHVFGKVFLHIQKKKGSSYKLPISLIE